MKMGHFSKDFLHKVPAPKAHLASLPYLSVSTRACQFLSVGFGIVGFLCLFFTDQIHHGLPYILGTAMLLLGLLDIFRGILTEEYKKHETKLTANGIVFVVLGLVILFNRHNIDNLIGAIWGTLGLLKGAEELNEAICSMAHKEKFISKTLRAAVELVLGILLLMDPAANFHHHLFILGLELITTGWEIWRDSKLPSYHAR